MSFDKEDFACLQDGKNSNFDLVKKVFIWFTLACFTITAIGVTVTQSRCKFTGEVMKSCCANDDGNCCKKEIHIVKIQDDYLFSTTRLNSIPLFTTLLSCNLISSGNEIIDRNFIKDDLSPPLKIQSSLSFTTLLRI
jgi:hypothetical protein